MVILLLILQGLVFLSDIAPEEVNEISLVDNALTRQLDSVKQAVILERKAKIYPFNPNYLTDFKAYTLGVSPEEVDRLFAFRNSGRFVQSVEQFQKVTEISDSLLLTLQPYLKFSNNTFQKQKANYPDAGFKKESKSEVTIKDLNSVTAEELKSVYGIGEKLSVRIIKFRDRLGGFLVDEQLYDVYGLDSTTVQKTLKRFRVLKAPKVTKINLHSATSAQLASLIYIRKDLAQKIVAFREKKGINSLEDLKEVEGFPADKIARIGLYLSLKKD